MDEHTENLEAVFIAANLREIEAVERLFTSEGIEYAVRPEQFVRSGGSSREFAGLLFEVLAGQAPYCRKLLVANGLQAGLVPPEFELRLEFPRE
jgi:hypothetical protein